MDIRKDFRANPVSLYLDCYLCVPLCNLLNASLCLSFLICKAQRQCLPYKTVLLRELVNLQCLDHCLTHFGYHIGTVIDYVIIITIIIIKQWTDISNIPLQNNPFFMDTLIFNATSVMN